MWQVFLMYALFGSIFSVGKIALDASQPYFLTSIRMLLAGGLLLAFSFFRKHKLSSLKRQDWWILLWVALFNVFITNAFEFWGLQYMSAGKTCLIYSLSPFVAALIAYFVGSDRMTGKKWLGLLIATICFFPMMIGPWMAGSETQNSMELAAEFALLTSAVTSVIGWTFVKKLTVEHQVPYLIVNAISFLMAGGMSFIVSAFIESWQPVPVTAWKEFSYSLLYIILIHNLICYSIYASSLRRFSVTFMSFTGLTCPLFAAFFGWIFLNEAITGAFWMAFGGIFAGLYLFYKEEKALKPI